MDHNQTTHHMLVQYVKISTASSNITDKKKDVKQLLSSAVEPQGWSDTEVFDVNSTVSL